MEIFYKKIHIFMFQGVKSFGTYDLDNQLDICNTNF